MQMITENILDVTLLEPRQKHPTIFNRFDELEEGESLTIHNDHDPKPLYYQLLGERGNIFVWEYLEQGPEWWKVRMTKRSSGEADETLGQLAAKDLRKAQIFKKYGLDFCCGGKKTVKQACKEKGLDVTKIEQELQQADQLPASRPLPYNDWKPGFLADYIVNTHHSYVRKNLPDIKVYATKVMRVHGQRHPELLEIWQLVEEIHSEMMSHMDKEENILFPYIQQLQEASQNKKAGTRPAFGTVQNPIKVMEDEHELVGKNLARIRELTDNYTLPQDACASYSLLYRMLDEFEEDLHLHVHLENNILFPKTLEMEKQLTS
jgi:regulator of cell morphogenesis and NO signaling